MGRLARKPDDDRTLLNMAGGIHKFFCRARGSLQDTMKYWLYSANRYNTLPAHFAPMQLYLVSGLVLSPNCLTTPDHAYFT